VSDNEKLKIFMMPQEFPCGQKSSCCGPIGQSEQEIQDLKTGIENELNCEVEVFSVKDDVLESYPQVARLLHSLGPNALPILTLSDEVVSIGKCKPQEALLAIREQTEKIKSGKENEMPTNNNSNEAGQESLAESSACCSSEDGGSSCCSPGSDAGSKSWKLLIFLVIVVAASAVLARSLISKSNSDSTQSEQVFASIQPNNSSDSSSPLEVAEKTETPVELKGKTEVPPVADESTKQDISVKVAPSLWGPDLDSLASLNKVAADTDAVFVLLAANDQLNDQAITKEIESAAQKIMSNGSRVSAFRLKESAPDYAQLAKQVSVPSVIAMVKGRGMSAVSGEINETKLVQAFVAASRSSGCGPAGCGPTGCGPTPAKLGPRR
jgi:hypothetical protein